MNNQISIAVLALISSSANAVQLTREPLLTWAPTAKDPPFKMNYGVPHFGTDHDIINAQDDIKLAEKQLGHIWAPKAPGDPPPTDYFVPHFGEDSDILASKQSIALGEKMHGTKWTIDDADKSPPPDRDYFVPHFGEDKDILETKNNIALMEKKYGKWDYPKAAADPPPVDYFVPHFGMDSDIVASLKNLKDEEKLHGTWNLEAVQLDSETDREPLLTWAPTPPKTHPMNYFVPHFGEDADIKDSKAHEALAAGKLGSPWNPAKDEDGNWVLPSPQIEFKLMQTSKK